MGHYSGGKDLENFSADIGRQLLELDLIDESHLQTTPTSGDRPVHPQLFAAR